MICYNCYVILIRDVMVRIVDQDGGLASARGLPFAFAHIRLIADIEVTLRLSH